jgi:hypothetical protein
MSRWADWFPISPEEATAFVEAKKRGAEAVLERLQPWLERLESLPLRVAMDKAWEPIYRCFNGIWCDDLWFKKRSPLLSLCVHGGDQLIRAGRRTASLVASERVPGVARALAKVEKKWFRKQFFLLPRKGLFHAIDEETFEWVWAHYLELPPFYAEVAEQGSAVICTISH